MEKIVLLTKTMAKYMIFTAIVPTSLFANSIHVTAKQLSTKFQQEQATINLCVQILSILHKAFHCALQSLFFQFHFVLDNISRKCDINANRKFVNLKSEVTLRNIKVDNELQMIFFVYSHSCTNTMGCVMVYYSPRTNICLLILYAESRLPQSALNRAIDWITTG